MNNWKKKLEEEKLKEKKQPSFDYCKCLLPVADPGEELCESCGHIINLPLNKYHNRIIEMILDELEELGELGDNPAPIVVGRKFALKELMKQIEEL
jgi:hypothetical protein